LINFVETPPPVRYFETRFLTAADKFIAGLDAKAIKKVLYNIDLAEQTNDPKLFKKTTARNLGVQDTI
jgi:hypothetical protein